MVDNNLGPDCLAGPQALTFQLLQSSNYLIARPWFGSINSACMVMSCASFKPWYSPNHTISVAHLT